MSNIIYCGKKNETLIDFIIENFNQSTLFHHYKSLCRNNYFDFIKSKNKVTYKKYLYSFRELINALWVYHNNSIPPIDFREAIEKNKSIIEKSVYLKLKEIIDIKSKGKEKELISNIDFLDKYIEDFINEEHKNLNNNKTDIDFLNDSLRNIVLNI
ncbi:MAG: nucleotidyltransferase domain-containing protein [Candidatus Gastranaerophilales bacterium]|nr:nucleotidyltransferase domain-containing protein [Candidatus Gastranaerophilales bacterium]